MRISSAVSPLQFKDLTNYSSWRKICNLSHLKYKSEFWNLYLEYASFKFNWKFD